MSAPSPCADAHLEQGCLQLVATASEPISSVQKQSPVGRTGCSASGAAVCLCSVGSWRNLLCLPCAQHSALPMVKIAMLSVVRECHKRHPHHHVISQDRKGGIGSGHYGLLQHRYCWDSLRLSHPYAPNCQSLVMNLASSLWFPL